MKKLLLLLLSLVLLACCGKKSDPDTKVWAWLAGKTTTTDEQWEHYFSNAAKAGIDAIILEVHGGYPEIIDSSGFEDKAAVQIVNNALPFAKKHNVELHAWIWTANRCEQNYRDKFPERYQVDALGRSCLDEELYGRKHYRWLCPSQSENAEYLKERVAELAGIDGLAGVHLDFIRYPDAILPYGLHESRGVVQDKVYPQWDFCYCDACRSEFERQTGTDPVTLEDPTADEKWMQFRWDAMAEFASEIAAEIKKHGKVSSAAVFASPEESKKLVRQDWANFKNVDIFFPMLYHKFYGWDDAMVETATREGVEALQGYGSDAYLCTGLFVGHVPKDRIREFIKLAMDGGSRGICFFSIEGIDREEGYWQALAEAVSDFKKGKIQ